MQGVSATVNGISAPLYYVSSGQIDFQLPYEVGAGPAVLAVNNNGNISVLPFVISPTAPGLYTSAIDNISGKAVSTAAAGSALLLFITGEGDVSPFLASGATPASGTSATALPKPLGTVQVTVGGISAPVLFAGIPSGLVGVSQINIVVPAGVAAGPQPVVVSVGGSASPPISLTVNSGQ
jgi:uncharacterized protein (TIGR03437 family)